MVSRILTVNAGSSSLKYAGFQVVGGELRTDTRTTGLVERIGEEVGHLHHIGQDGSVADEDVDVADPAAALLVMQEALGRELSDDELMAVGHRVVHVAASFTEATVVDPAVEAEVARLAPLAPLHNPVNLAGIRSAARAFPGVPQVAVFDTAFHAGLSAEAYTYAVPADLADSLELRRWGFQGVNCAYVTRAAAELLGKPVETVQLIICHLGNGASVTAIRGGRSVDTSMGMTPLEGLVMGTRSGDVDPAVVVRLQEKLGLTGEEALDVLNNRSGLVGLSGESDVRSVRAQAESGDPHAELALAVYAHRLRKYVGAYLTQLPELDALVFTAGVGEHDAAMRSDVVRPLHHLGLWLDEDSNSATTHPDGPVVLGEREGRAVVVVPADEELEIAQQTLDLLTTSS
jgi:acetate kinase